ncbi:MAG: amino acid ABC transporter permease [Streptococcaceae bacterium]|jgi:polar amino acid transport system permease protein|nr:amino acid ABC transporter permease [Streptococcaceae bacterium]
MSYILSILPQLSQGFLTTLEVFAVTLVLSLPLGLFFGFLLRVPLVKRIMALYVWVMRGTPLILQIIIIYFALPNIGITMPPFVAVSFAITMNYAAYFAEIFRGGLQSIPLGQLDAARVLGLSKWDAARFVIIPQAVRIVIPSVMNEVLNLSKDTSLVYIVGSIFDLMQNAWQIQQRDPQSGMIALFAAGGFYLILTAVLTFLAHLVENALNVERKGKLKGASHV